MIGYDERETGRGNAPLNERDALRRHMKKLRAEQFRHQSEILLRRSEQIAERVLKMPECVCAERVMCYYSLSGEVQTVSLIRALIAAGKEVYLPVTDRNRKMNAVRLCDADAVHAGAFRVMEPNGNERIGAEQLDLIIVPGLAFDRKGGRMGYGAGCYDRFLPACRGVTAALSFEFQLVERVPMDAHDVYMQYVVTEQGVYDCRSGMSAI